MEPADADDEEHRGQRGRVHHGGAEVRLEEDEPHRYETQPDGRQHGADLTDAPRAVDEEAGEREDEEHLAELRRLELEGADHEPSLGAADGGAGDVDEQHDPDRSGVHGPPVPTHEGGRHQHGDQERDAAEACSDRLADHVMVGIARNVEARDARDRPEPVAEERRDREQPRAEVELEPRRFRRGGRQLSHEVDHQSVFTRGGGVAALTPNHCSKTSSAAGAAAVEP